MAEELTVGASKDAIVERVRWLVSSGQSLTASCAAIEQETGQKAGTTKTQFYWVGKVAALTSTATTRAHGNQKLLDRQDTILVAVLLVLLAQNEGIAANLLIQRVQKLFGVKVSKGWVKRFLKRNNEDVSLRKMKLLAKKRAAKDIPDHVERFLAEVERCGDYFKMTETNVCN